MEFGIVFDADSEYDNHSPLQMNYGIKSRQVKLIVHHFATKWRNNSIFSTTEQNSKNLNMYFCSSDFINSNEIRHLVLSCVTKN
jgi:hypothetical protein